MADVITCIEDLRVLAQKRVPRAFYDYADSGSYTEGTYRSNSHDLSAIKIRQRVAIDVDKRNTASTMIGQPVTMPLALAPVGLTGMQWADGEILAARAAERFGVPFTLSTMSICSIEDVAGAVSKPFWFQLYVMRDRGFIAELIGRAKAAKCSALVLTLDLQILGQRHKDLKNGMSVPPKITLANLIDIACKPGWALRMLGAKRKTFGNLAGAAKGGDGVITLSKWVASQFDPTLSWADIDWIRSQWGGKLILKGIQDPEDARIAATVGADALIVSNHGGRQLDGAYSSIRALPRVVDAVGGKTEIWMDGGIRSGQDLLKTLASGASAALIGRAFTFGLGAMGEAGVTKALEIIRSELDVSMALAGVSDVRKLDRSVLE